MQTVMTVEDKKTANSNVTAEQRTAQVAAKRQTSSKWADMVERQPDQDQAFMKRSDESRFVTLPKASSRQ